LSEVKPQSRCLVVVKTLPKAIELDISAMPGRVKGGAGSPGSLKILFATKFLTSEKLKICHCFTQNGDFLQSLFQGA